MGITAGFPRVLRALWVDHEALFIHVPAPNETSSVNPGQEAGALLLYMVRACQKMGMSQNISVLRPSEMF